MSTASATPTPVSAISPRTSSRSFRVIDSLLALIPMSVALIGIVLGVLIAFNAGELQSSFWLGLLFTLLLAIMPAALWMVVKATNQMTRFVGALVIVISSVGLALMITGLSGDSFTWGKFGWGALTALILCIVYASIKFYGWLSRKSHK